MNKTNDNTAGSRRRRPRTKVSSRKRPKAKDQEDFINPMDFWDVDAADIQTQSSRPRTPAPDIKPEGLFVVGTDFGAGKTISICVLGTVLQHKQIKTAAFKPVECGGQDNHVFIEAFQTADFLPEKDVYFFKDQEPPYFVFKKNKADIDLKKIGNLYQKMKKEHTVTFVEAPGGLMEPLSEKYTTTDLIKHLKLDVVIVAPLKKGSLNHVMMTVSHLRQKRIHVRGVLFTQAQSGISKEYFLANVQAVQDLAGVPVIGVVPFLEKGSPEEILQKCDRKISFKVLLGLSLVDKGNKKKRPLRKASRPVQVKRKQTVSRGAATQETSAQEEPAAKDLPSKDGTKSPLPQRRRRSRGRKRPVQK